MHIDWNLVVTLCIFAMMQFAALMKAYYGLKADNQATRTELQRAIDLTRGGLEKTADHDRAHMTAEITRIEKLVTEASTRIHSLETGSDEWTKSLRERTHDLATNVQNMVGSVNSLVLRIDRLERPTKGAAE